MIIVGITFGVVMGIGLTFLFGHWENYPIEVQEVNHEMQRMRD